MEENHKIKQNFFRKACGIDCLEAKKIIHKICETWVYLYAGLLGSNPI